MTLCLCLLPPNNLLLPTSSQHNLYNIVPNLRHRDPHLISQDIAEARESVHLALHQLIALARQLHKFASIYVRVPAIINVLNEFGRYGWEGCGMRGGVVDFEKLTVELLAV